MLRLGVAIQETWGFFNEIYADFQQHYQTTLFKRRVWQLPIFHSRINRYLYFKDLQSFMGRNDVVFFEWASGLLVNATKLPKTCGIVTRLHRYEMYEWVEKINWEIVDRIVLVSEAKRQEFITRFPEQSAKTAVAYPSISLQKFSPVTKNFQGNIGILCNLIPRKRVYELILTFYEVSQQNNNLHLHIGGGHDPAQLDYYEALRDLVARLQLKDKVTFYGHVSDTSSWYHHIDIFISNSYSEGLQVALMEAMASGCYCLSHRWVGAEEILPDDNLYFTDRELIEKILLFCEIAEKEKQKQGSLMREIACDKLDIEVTKIQIRKIIEDVKNSSLSTSNGRSL